MTDVVAPGAQYGFPLQADAPRLGAGTYGFADRSAAEQVVREWNAQPPPPTPLVHTLTPRLLATGAVLALLGLLGDATWTALRESQWRQPRPLLQPQMAAAAVGAVLAGCWWLVAAATNGRRVGQRHTVGPMVAVAHLIPVALWLIVDRVVDGDGDVRRWAWVAWAGLAVVLNYGVALAFRASSAAMGRTSSHFTALATLPVFIVGAAVAAVFQEVAVFALPVAAVMAVWWTAELWQGMGDWDDLCRERGGWHRPEPVAEVEPFAAAVAAATATAAAAAAPDDDRHHHTTTPRAMVVASFLLSLSLPAWAVLLERKGHLVLAGRDSVLDAEGRKVAAGLALAMFGSYAIGWMWWSAAAAANAARRVRHALSPMLAPLAYFVIVGIVAVVPEIDDRVQPQARPWVAAIGAMVAVTAHFGVLRAYRRTAEAIKAPVAPWKRVILLPWAALVFSYLMGFFGQTLTDDAYAMTLGAAWVVFYLAYLVSFYQAMAGFDRACAGRQLTHDADSIPEFLKKPR